MTNSYMNELLRLVSNWIIYTITGLIFNIKSDPFSYWDLFDPSYLRPTWPVPYSTHTYPPPPSSYTYTRIPHAPYERVTLPFPHPLTAEWPSTCLTWLQHNVAMVQICLLAYVQWPVTNQLHSPLFSVQYKQSINHSAYVCSIGCVDQPLNFLNTVINHEGWSRIYWIIWS